MRYHAIMMLAFFQVTMLIGCKDADPKNAIAVVDLSSSRDSVVKLWYKKTIVNSILMNLQKKDRIIVLPADYASETVSSEVFKVDFARNVYFNEFAGLQAEELEMKSHRDSIAVAVKQFDESFNATWEMRRQLPAGTDLIGALKQAKKYVQPECANVLILLSDMLIFSDAGRIDFEGKLNSFEEIDKYLSKVEKVDLTGVHVFVVTGSQNSISPEKFSIIRAFWERYFAECNAELIDYSSEALSKLEEYLGSNSK